MTSAEKEQSDMREPKKRTVRRATGAERRPVALIDAEIVTYHVCMDLLQEERVGDDEYTWSLPIKQVRLMLGSRIEQLRREAGCGKVVLAVGSRNNWRRRVMPEYKAGRVDKKKPLGYWDTVAWLRENYDVREENWLEADDVLGLLHTGPEFKAFGVDTVVVSNDKDMRTLPGLLYNFGRPTPAVERISPVQADLNHLALALAGDPTDGYKGAKGVGEKTAAEELAKATRLRPPSKIALDLFLAAGHDREYALQQCRVARVLRHGEYDRAAEKISLWSFPHEGGLRGGPGEVKKGALKE